MRLIRQQDDMNVVPHKALTVVTRHNFDTPKDDIQVYNTHYDTFAGAPAILYSMQMLDGVMPKAEVYVPNVTYIGAYFYRSSNVEEAEIWCPKCQKACNTPLDCVFYISEVKRAKVHFGDALLSSGLQFAFSGSTSTYSPKLERLELTGCRNAVNLSYMLHHTRRIYHLRFDELPNAGSMTFFALDTIFDKPTVLHIRDLLVAGGNTG